MLYLANPTTGTAEHMHAGTIGFIDTPLQGNKRPDGITWCADNSCFGKGYPGDEKWFSWLERHADSATHCLFATAPDVVGDAEATLTRSLPWLPRIRALGYKAAFVLQDGADVFPPPWGEFDCLFVGGSTEFKLGPITRRYVREAKERGLWVHMGRVNSKRRYLYAELIGCDSVDGTYLVFGPDVNLPKLLGWINEEHLFRGIA